MSCWTAEPVDRVLFRDGRPFTPGEMSRARLLGVTPPQTGVYGMLRHTLLETLGISYTAFGEGDFAEEWKELLGTPAQAGSLAIGPVLAAMDTRRELTPFLTYPADLVDCEDPKKDRQVALLMPAFSEAVTSLPDELRPLTPKIRDAERDGYTDCPPGSRISSDTAGRLLPATEEALADYLCARAITGSYSVSDYFRPEPLVGIELDMATRRPVNSMLYVAEYLRPAFDEVDKRTRKRFRAVFAFDVLDGSSELPSTATVSMGGERRPFLLSRRDGEFCWGNSALKARVRRFLEDRCFRDGELRFRLVLMSPAPAGQTGWKPGLDKLGGVEFTIVAAAVPRARWFSGWDLARRAPRDAAPYIDAGSVFFVSARSTTGDLPIDQIMDRFWYRSICGGDAGKAGNGFVLIGGWPYA